MTRNPTVARALVLRAEARDLLDALTRDSCPVCGGINPQNCYRCKGGVAGEHPTQPAAEP